MASKPKMKAPITLNKGQMLRVKAEHDGYRRGGMVLSKAGVDFAEGKFTAEQLAAWQADPRITLVAVDQSKAEQ